MDVYKTLATLKQGRKESIQGYFERFNYYLDCYPYHGFQLHELMKFYLDGLCLGEQTIINIMAGGSIMERTPEEVWYLIQDRTEDTRSCVQYLMVSREELEYQRATAERMFHQKHREAIARQVAEEFYQQRIAEIKRESDEIDNIEDECKLKSATEPIQVSPDDEEETLSVYDNPLYDEEESLPLYDEEVTLLQVEENLQVVPITSVEDVPTEEWNSPQSSGLIIKQDTVITCNPVTSPISDILVSSHVQNDTIPKALRNNQVWGSLEKCTLYIPMLRNPTMMQTSEQFTDGLCVNWKTRKKRMRGSLQDTHTHEALALRLPKRRDELHKLLRRTWKRRIKGKRVIVNIKCSIIPILLQDIHYSTFGWKPGWSLRGSVSHKVIRKERKVVRKFDGVHPWAPNIS